MSDYKRNLWEEIARNDPVIAKAIAATKKFNPELMTFRWLKEPKHVFCTYNRKAEP